MSEAPTITVKLDQTPDLEAVNQARRDIKRAPVLLLVSGVFLGAALVLAVAALLYRASNFSEEQLSGERALFAGSVLVLAVILAAGAWRKYIRARGLHNEVNQTLRRLFRLTGMTLDKDGWYTLSFSSRYESHEVRLAPAAILLVQSDLTGGVQFPEAGLTSQLEVAFGSQAWINEIDFQRFMEQPNN